MKFYSQFFALLILLGFIFSCNCNPAGERFDSEKIDPLQFVFEFEGREREYFVWLPANFDKSKKYWVLVIAHGGGEVNSGRRFWMTKPIWKCAQQKGLDVIIVTPTFHKPDPIPERYPIKEGQFLSEIIDRIKKDYKVFPKILLTGYSRGGQFSHRYTLWYPDRVQACAPFAAGSWTTPDGRLLDPALGEIKNPNEFLLSITDKEKLRLLSEGPPQV